MKGDVSLDADYRLAGQLEPFYQMNGTCSNCGTDVCGTFSKGQAANSALGPRECPLCGCKKVSFAPDGCNPSGIAMDNDSELADPELAKARLVKAFTAFAEAICVIREL